MLKITEKPPTILVTDAGRGSAIAIIRSLGRKGYRVIAADSAPQSLGFRSRYAGERLVYPAPENAPREFCDCLLDAAKAQDVALIIPATDLAIQPLSAERHLFAGITQLALPGAAQLEIVTDKVKTVQLAKRVDVPVPETCVIDTVDEAVEKAPQLGWPIVLKPQSSRRLHPGEKIESFKVTYAADLNQLEAAMSRFAGRCSVLLQSYCEGIGYGVELLMKDGRPLAAFQHRRRREIPLTGGASAYRESVALDGELYGYSLRLLSELRWTGLAMVEFKVGQSGARLMEINGRVWGSLPLAVASGVDFPALLAALYLHGEDAVKLQLESNYRLGVRCRDLQRDLMWIAAVLLQRRHHPFLAMPSRKRALLALLGLFNPQRKFDLLTLQDPLPGIAELPRILKKFRGKINEIGRDCGGSAAAATRRADHI
jgi:predicted ATP-grasp superfamily ATP-dependent carboligase